MKKLVGKIYRDENGNTVMEPVSNSDFKSLWLVEESEIAKPDKFGYDLVCPKCKERYHFEYNAKESCMLYSEISPYCKARVYCGYCGHRNIIKRRLNLREMLL